MGALLETFRQQPAVYTLFTLAAGSLTLVNQLEMPFARSLIACEEPVRGFSGSVRCGDRLRVINEGVKLSSQAQSQEHLWRMFALVLAAATADAYGRRPVLLFGSFCVTVSVLLFVMASLSQDVAHGCFVIAQGLQGAMPLDLLNLMICQDIATETSDSQGVFAMMTVGMTVATLTSIGCGSAFQYLELCNFTQVWLALLCALTLGLLASVAYFPETSPRDTAEVGGVRHVLQTARGELAEYASMLRGNALVRCSMMRDVFKALACADSLHGSTCMAYYSLSQFGTLLVLLPVHGWVLMWIGITHRFSHHVGERRTFFLMRVWLHVTMTLLVALVPFGLYGMLLYQFVPKIGYGVGALEAAIATRCVPKHLLAKAAALTSLNSEMLNAVAIAMYAYLFDARATAYWPRFLPYLVSGCWSLLSFTTFWVKLWPIHSRAADELQEERQLEREKKEN